MSPADTAALIERAKSAAELAANGPFLLELATAIASAEAQVAALKAARDELLDKLDDRIRMHHDIEAELEAMRAKCFGCITPAEHAEALAALAVKGEKPSPFDVPRGEGLFMGDDDDQ